MYLQSCQVQMIKNLDVVGAFSSYFSDCARPLPKKNFLEQINIARLPLFQQQTANFLAFLLFYFPLYKHVRFSFERTDNIFANCVFVRIREIFKTNRETWRSARKPGDTRVNRETWQLCIYTVYNLLSCQVIMNINNCSMFVLGAMCCQKLKMVAFVKSDWKTRVWRHKRGHTYTGYLSKTQQFWKTDRERYGGRL